MPYSPSSLKLTLLRVKRKGQFKMAYPFGSTRITFDSLVGKLRSVINGFPDKRTGKNTRFSIEDAALGAFSVFFTQSPSFLSYQKMMQEAKGKNNAQTLFGISEIPTDNHIRNLLDQGKPSLVFPVFKYIFNELNLSGLLNPFRSINGNLLIALDGTQYFSSQNIHCENCSETHHKNGTITYSHSAITPVIVAPGNKNAIALTPEFIIPQDGHDKQDSEPSAAKRWITHYAPIYKAPGITLLGDDLYCHHPICELILKEELNFIFVCKPDSHKTLYEWVEELEAMGAVKTVKIRRRHRNTFVTDTYRFTNQVPLRDSHDALMVNWCELITTKKDGTVIYKNAFATNHKITEDNVNEIVSNGRARWKIENENNNTLKTKGYNLEHNFGHGKKNLSSLLVTFNILAFLFHTFLGMIDEKYHMIRQKLPTRKTFFDDIRALTRYICFDSWNDMLNFMMNGLELEFPDTS